MATVKKKPAAAKKAPAKKAPAKKVPAKKVPAKKVPAKNVPAHKPAPAKAAATRSGAATATRTGASRPASAGAATTASVSAGTKKPQTVASKKPPVAPVIPKPVVKGVTKDGIAYTKDFDAKFLTARREQLLREREFLVGQATRLEDEVHQLTEEHEMGDVDFGDEGGEGDTLVVERERDIVLSAQVRQTVDEIDLALQRLTTGAYGYSVESGRPIPRERLEALPWSTVLVEEKVGGFGRR